ncbi:hypothetical protein AB4393_18290 [Vibrio splendidus]
MTRLDWNTNSRNHFKLFFFLSSVGPIVLALGLALAISINSNVQPSKPTYESIELFFNLFSKPILILSSAFPLCAFVISYYRHEQTQEALQFNRYIEHMKLFKERISEADGLLGRIEVAKAYGVMYPKAKVGEFDLGDFQVQLYDSIKSILRYVEQYQDDKKSLKEEEMYFALMIDFSHECLDRFGVQLNCKNIESFLCSMDTVVLDFVYLISSDYFSKTQLSNEIKGVDTLLKSSSDDIKINIKNFLDHDFGTVYENRIYY